MQADAVWIRITKGDDMSTTMCDDTWDDVKRMAFRQAWSFHQRFGMDFDEAASAASEAFARAYREWDSDHESGASFSTYAWHKIKNALVTERCRSARWMSRNRPGEDGLERGRPRGRESTLSSILTDLGDDARTIVMAVVDPPDEEMRKALLRGPRRATSLLRRRLLSIGWSVARIIDSFREVSEALES